MEKTNKRKQREKDEEIRSLKGSLKNWKTTRNLRVSLEEEPLPANQNVTHGHTLYGAVTSHWM